MALLVGATACGTIASAIIAATLLRDESLVTRFAAAVGPHRVTRARLTGGFAYAPCDTLTPEDSLVTGLICAGSRPEEWPEAGDIARLAPELRASSQGVAADSALHASGNWHVVWGNADRAIEDLRAAAHATPEDASIQSDLAAALLARAEKTQDPRSIVDACAAVDSAIALDPDHPEARFNRAVILESLNLRQDAIAEWSAFLELDGSSPWANEAREHLRLLRVSPPDWRTVQPTLEAAVVRGDDSALRAIARTFPVRVSDETRMAMIGWARSHQAGDPRADSLMSRGRAFAEATAAVSPDSLWLDAIVALTRSSERSERSRLDAAARGLVAYETARAYLDRFKADSAVPWLVEAEHALTAAGNPARYLAVSGLARATYDRRLPSAVVLTAVRHVQAETPNAYRLVRARAARTEGLVHGVDANFRAAIAAYLAAIREGAGTGDPGVELQPHANLAFNYANLGLDEDAWNHLYSALRASRQYPEADRDARFIFIIAARLSWQRAPQAASLFQREAVRLASLTTTSRRDSLALVSALERQAELFGRAGQSKQAFESLKQARSYLAGIDPDSVTASFTADIELVEGWAWLGVDPSSAVRVLRSVVARYRSTQYNLEVDRALLLLANAYAATGAMDSAQRAFSEAITETERRRSNIPSADDRAQFLDRARPLIDQIITFLIDRGDTVGALEFLERMRSRVLLERVQNDGRYANPADRVVDAMQSTLPPRTSVVSYVVLQGQVIAWLIGPDRVSMYRIPDVAGLEQLTNRFSALIEARSSGAEVRRTAAELHRLLLAPIIPTLDQGSRLIVVPDKWLHFVPFGALFDETTKAFAVERFEIGIAPSLQLYQQSAARYKQLRTAAPPAVLAVGNPTFDAQVFALPPLPGAEEEVRNVGALYPGARVLIGTRATRRAFLSSMVGSDVVHFAGHGVVRPDAPLSSYLLFAADGSSEASATLTARELFDIRLPRTRLAILSGCHTASGQLSETEGASSLARALFAAGVPAVVASLWAVDDKAAAEFFASYHRRLSQREDPTAALRNTQLEWIANRADAWQTLGTWAAFALFGATTGES